MIGSGIICCVPQAEECPVKCPDCFFQSGRSYLEPLNENLPNMPSAERAKGFVVRVNDGNDSNVQRELVIASTKIYKDKFYNTSIPRKLKEFDAPVVLTINPGLYTNTEIHPLSSPLPINLMFVRVRVCSWNLDLVAKAVEYYTERNVPVVLTFMRYYDTAEGMPKVHKDTFYVFKKKVLNDYWCLNDHGWKTIMNSYEHNKLVYSCGREGEEHGWFECRRCGHCLREYFNTKRRMRLQSEQAVY